MRRYKVTYRDISHNLRFVVIYASNMGAARKAVMNQRSYLCENILNVEIAL